MKHDVIYAVRIIGRSGYQAKNGYWKIGGYIRRSVVNVDLSVPATADPRTRATIALGACSLAEADFGSRESANALHEEMTSRFPDLLTEVVRFVGAARRRRKYEPRNSPKLKARRSSRHKR